MHCVLLSLLLFHLGSLNNSGSSIPGCIYYVTGYLSGHVPVFLNWFEKIMCLCLSTCTRVRKITGQKEDPILLILLKTPVKNSLLLSLFCHCLLKGGWL